MNTKSHDEQNIKILQRLKLTLSNSISLTSPNPKPDIRFEWFKRSEFKLSYMTLNNFLNLPDSYFLICESELSWSLPTPKISVEIK